MSNAIDPFLRGPQIWLPFGCTGRSRPALYVDIEKGLFPPGIRLGRQAVGWFRSEVEAVMNARAAAASDGELRELVLQLIARRKSLAPWLTGGAVPTADPSVQVAPIVSAPGPTNLEGKIKRKGERRVTA
jgi:prophage regulatory protein